MRTQMFLGVVCCSLQKLHQARIHEPQNMGRFLLVVTVLLSLITTGFALKCYVCGGTEDACSKSKLEGDKDTYLKTCTGSLDRCYRTWSKKDDVTGVTNGCTNEAGCTVFETACKVIKDADNGGDCAVGCCSDDECNAGSPVSFSFFLLILSAVLSLALMK